MRNPPTNQSSPISKTIPDSDFLSALDPLKEKAYTSIQWFYHQIFSINSIFQLAFIFFSILIGIFTQKFLIKTLSSIKHPLWQKLIGKNGLITILITPVIIYLLLILSSTFYVHFTKYPIPILKIATQLSAVWIVIRLISCLIKNSFWSKTAAISAWIIAALNALGLLDNLIKFLDHFSFQLGKTRISIWIVIKGVVLISLLILTARVLSKNIKNRIRKAPGLTPSIRILFGQILQVVLFAAALFIGLTSLGIDLSFLAIFGGAIGLGIGFGLQSVIANFISGIILLLDQSLKPGDVISVDDTYGIVEALNLRYSAIITRDGIEHLIPNETFITQQVINWSHSDHKVRIKRSIGVSYNTDLRRAQELAVEATKTITRVLNTPSPVCHLLGFGDSSITLQIRFWITDPAQGVNNISSEVLFAIWEIYKKNNIQFPFPQRDINLKQDGSLDIRVLKEK